MSILGIMVYAYHPWITQYIYYSVVLSHNIMFTANMINMTNKNLDHRQKHHTAIQDCYKTAQQNYYYRL